MKAFSIFCVSSLIVTLGLNRNVLATGRNLLGKNARFQHLSAFDPPTVEFNVAGQQGALPAVGLGTALLGGEPCVNSVVSALKIGFRMIDTALLYGNQVEVGEGIRKSGVPRDSIFITTKVGFFPPDSDQLWQYNSNCVKGQEEASLDLCLQQLGVDYVDLLLIHNPTTSAAQYNSAIMPHFFELANRSGWDTAISPTTLPDGEEIRPILINYKRSLIKENFDPVQTLQIRKESWAALERAKKAGKCKFIGVSNYTPELLLEMKEYAEIMPAVNQIECHPVCAVPELRRVAKDMGVALIGYGVSNSCLISKHPIIEEIATKLNKSYFQVVERWMIQNHIVPITQSRSPEHMSENFSVFDFELSQDDMDKINQLNRNYPYYWDPDSIAMTSSRA